MNTDLHTSQDDFRLNALGDTERSAGLNAAYTYYLTDPDGNRLTDTEGNYLTAYFFDTVYPQMLHALPDDFNLNAE